MTTIPWFELLGSTPVEIAATVSAIAGVWLIARQNILGWPLGILWAALSAWLALTQWQLVSDGILYLAYIPIQLYCWIVWARSGAHDELPYALEYARVWLEQHGPDDDEAALLEVTQCAH